MTNQTTESAPLRPEPIPGFENFGHIRLDGVSNCRDLGGFPCEDGKRIQPGRLVRSSELHGATEKDMHELETQHGLQRVIDLRTAFELERQLDPIQEMEGIEYINLRPIATESELAGNEGDPIAALKRIAENTSEVFLNLYEEMVTSEHSIKVFSEFLNILLDADSGATLWHCTQGKDRTGLAAIFVERALGASEEVIRADYMATNLFVKGKDNGLASLMRDVPLVDKLESDLKEAIYVYPENLDCALKHINEMSGSLDAYIVNELDFDTDKQMKLREMYLA